MANDKFSLSAELHGHEMDVRALCAMDNNIISGSRDKSVRLWSANTPSSSTSAEKYQLAAKFEGHSHFVNTVTYMSPSQEYPKGLIISGSMDKLILVWNPDQPNEPLFTLIGHKDTVCTLHVLPGTSTLISGSWDKTARVWESWNCKWTFEGHEHAVWAVLALHATTFITASADKLIRIWKSGKCTKKISGHTDVVRGLARIDAKSFVSCGNDGSLRVWDLEGNCLRELFGHTSFVYSVSVLPGGDLISSGEDKSVRVWKGDLCVETIILPAQSVWAVCALKNGDIVSGTNDGIIRVFTKDPMRIADEDTLKNYEEAVSKSTVNAKELGDIQKEKVPGIETLSMPGKKDQEVKMVKNTNGTIEAHQWSAAQGQWIKLGEVVDAVGSSRKQIYEGKEYDYVFDVDIEDGAPPLKLPYNVTENPYATAQEFIQRNELSVNYLDQVANFIITNTKGATLGMGSSSSSGDPYTSSRYVPGGAPTATSSVTYSNPDPFTGSSHTKPSGIVPLPANSYLNFKTGNIEAAEKKTLELCKKNLTSESDIKLLSDIFAAIGGNSTSASINFGVIEKLIGTWPVEDAFPLFDVLRMAIFAKGQFTGFPSVSFALEKSRLQIEEEINVPTVIMILRLLCNYFSVQSMRKQVLDERIKIVSTMIQSQKLIDLIAMNANVSLALITLLLNFSIALVHEIQDEDLAMEITTFLCEQCKRIKEREEDFYRGLVTIGNLSHKYRELKQILQVLEFKANVLQSSSGGAERIQSISKEIMHINGL